VKDVVAIALSGGVDSFVSAYLLKQKQKQSDLFGIHFTTGYEKKILDFSSMEAQLGIRINHVDIGKLFQKNVVNYFVRTYLNGKTPNPCLICNKTIKFAALFNIARTLGANKIATGHYARIRHDKYRNACLFKGRDDTKEQSYFLSMLSKEQLENVIFPLGDMTKSDVVRFADQKGFVLPDKTESQDICFIHDESFSDFILSSRKIKPEPGDIVTTRGKIIGRHNGLLRFTIGQRRGINCPGPAPYYVTRIDMENNRLVVGFKDELYQKEFILNDLNIINSAITSPVRVVTKIRYSHQGAPSLFIPHKTEAKVIFDTPQHAVTPGQAAVFYKGEQVLGAGIIQ